MKVLSFVQYENSVFFWGMKLSLIWLKWWNWTKLCTKKIDNILNFNIVITRLKKKCQFHCKNWMKILLVLIMTTYINTLSSCFFEKISNLWNVTKTNHMFEGNQPWNYFWYFLQLHCPFNLITCIHSFHYLSL